MSDISNLTSSPASILNTLPPLSSASRLWVAYSGGCDSHVLLHLLWRLRAHLPPISVVHVNHGLQGESASWAIHCQAACDELALPCHIHTVNAHADKGQSPEDAARMARYEVFHSLLGGDDLLCLAQHQDDQAETFLLQLLRGAGPKGLGSMAVHGTKAGMNLWRPLLAYSRQQLVEYAREHALAWVDDPSNAQTQYRRNYLRHEVVPILKNKWPAVNKVIARSASHCAEAAELLADLARKDLQSLQLDGVNQLSLPMLRLLSEARQKNVLRYWLSNLLLPTPSEAKLQHIIKDVVSAREDAQPMVGWPGAEVRRFRDRLYAMTPLPVADNLAEVIECQLGNEVTLLDKSRLVWQEGVVDLALDVESLQGRHLEVRYRQGQLKCQPAGALHHRSLKNLFQELEVEPWLRARWPLLYADGVLVTAVGLFVVEGWQARQGVGVRWLR